MPIIILFYYLENPEYDTVAYTKQFFPNGNINGNSITLEIDWNTQVFALFCKFNSCFELFNTF